MAVEIASHITIDPSAPLNKPIIQGTQIPVESVIAKLAAGMTAEEVAKEYKITLEDIWASLSYAAKVLAVEETQSLLEKSAQANHHQKFVALAEAIDWSTSEPDQLVRAIDLALSLELAALAIKLAQQGSHLFPNHERIQQAARVLAPSIGRTVPALQAKGLSASKTWLRDHAHQYQGQWVAVYKGELLGVAESLQKLMTIIDQDAEAINTIITKVL